MDAPEEDFFSSADWARIQSSLNPPKPKVCTREQALESNALYLISKTQDKLKIAKHRKLREAIQLKKQAKEDNLNMLAAEEVELKKQERHAAIDKVNNTRFYQYGCMRQFNSAFLATHVHKENEAIMEFKQDRRRIAKELERQSEEEMRSRQKEALRQEQEKARQRQRSNQAQADHHIQQMKKNKQLREEERQQEKAERQRLRGLVESHEQDLRHEADIQLESKKRYLKYQREEISSREALREREAQKLDTEEKERKRVHFVFEERLQQTKQNQAAKFSERQKRPEIVAERLAVTAKKQFDSRTQREDALVSKAVAERDAKVAKQQKDKEEKRAAMLKSISAHREAQSLVKKQKANAEKQSDLALLEAKNQSDRLFHEEEKQQAKREREKIIKCQAFNATLIAEKCADQMKKKEHDAAHAKGNAEQIAQREKQLQHYVQRKLHKPAESQRNVPHRSTASPGGHGVDSDGEQPDYMCKNTVEKKPIFAIDQTRILKRHLQHNSLQISMVDIEPIPLPPISRAPKPKSTDTVADKGVQHSSTVGVEGSRYCSRGTGESFPSICKAQTTKKVLNRTKLQQNNEQTSAVNLKPTCLPPVSTKDKSKSRHTLDSRKTATGLRCTPAIGEYLPRSGTVQTRPPRQYLDCNKLPIVFEKASKIDLKKTRLPPTHHTIVLKSTNTSTEKTDVVDGSNYVSKYTGDSLPRLSTENSCSTKQNLEGNMRQPIYKEHRRFDLKPTLLPPISIKGVAL